MSPIDNLRNSHNLSNNDDDNVDDEKPPISFITVDKQKKWNGKQLQQQPQKLGIRSRSEDPNPELPRQSLVIRSRRNRTTAQTSAKNLDCSAMILALISLIVFWFVCFVLLMTRTNNGYNSNGIRSISSIHNVMESYRSGLRKQNPQLDIRPATPSAVAESPQRHHQQPHLVSRLPNKVVATA